MNQLTRPALVIYLATLCGSILAADTKAPSQRILEGTNGVRLIVRAQGPYDADVPLQVVCYFKHKPTGDTTQGAPVELDRRLGGVVASLRNRGEFVGDELETLLLKPPAGTIQPKLLLLIGLGEESSLTLATMERVGRTAYRHAAMLEIDRVSFAPLLRDQGNSKLSVGDVETAVVRGILSAHDTNKRLHSEGLAKGHALTEWLVEAGPAFFNDTIAGVEKGVTEVKHIIERRSGPYSRKPE